MKSLTVTAAIILVVIVSLEARIQDFNLKRINVIDRNARGRFSMHDRDSKRKSMMIREDDFLQQRIPHYTKGVCSTPCKPHEICLTEKGSDTSMCIDKKKARESRRLFRKYQRKQKKGFHNANRRQMRKDRFMKRQRLHDRKPMINDYKHWAEKFHQRRGRNDKFSRRRMMGRPNHMKHSRDFKRPGMRKQFDGRAMLDNLEAVQTLLTDSKKQGKPVCKAEEMNTLRKRVEGWFVVLHEKHRQERHGHLEVRRLKRNANKNLDEVEAGKCNCLKSVMWELHRLDRDHDHHLSKEELIPVEMNHQEACITPLLQSCNRDADPRLSKTEWCCCFPVDDPPCIAKVKQVTNAGLLGAYIPQCTHEGYFKRKQCHGGTGYCWCSDLNGNEINGSRKHSRDGMPDCDKYDARGDLKGQ